MIEQRIQAVIKPLCDRVFFDIAPDNVVSPYVVIHGLGGKAWQYVSGQMAPNRRILVQVNTWAKTRKESSELSMIILNEMVADQIVNVEVDGEIVTTYDPDESLYGAFQDYRVEGAR